MSGARDDAAIPDGYVRVAAHGVEAVAAVPYAAAVRAALRTGTLYAWAGAHPERRELAGRAPAYAVPLPGGATDVVVRHARHGGLLARVTGDRFLRPRAAHELRVALRLRRAGVPTPDVVAYALHPAGRLLRRADVATRLVPASRDLAASLADPDPGVRARAISATRDLLRVLAAAGARHPDLNIKNVLIADRDGAMTAWVIDVDRVRFDRPGEATATPNLRRLRRSLEKLRPRLAPGATDDAIRFLAADGRQ